MDKKLSFSAYSCAHKFTYPDGILHVLAIIYDVFTLMFSCFVKPFIVKFVFTETTQTAQIKSLHPLVILTYDNDPIISPPVLH